MMMMMMMTSMERMWWKVFHGMWRRVIRLMLMRVGRMWTKDVLLQILMLTSTLTKKKKTTKMD